MSFKRVQLNLYISHKAALRKSPTKEGFTHDWMVMLTGDEKVKLDHLIEKVVFRLHPTFPNSKRGKHLTGSIYKFNTDISLKQK